MSTVTFHHIGRLGNAMFQCAAAIGYAKKHNMQWTCPSNTGEVPRFHELFPNLNKGDFWAGERYEAHDPSMFNYQEIPHFRNGVKLIGFFQSEKYFMNAKAEVREAFKLKEYGMNETVSIHIRRGDYLEHAASFPTITTEYVRLAIEEIEKRVPVYNLAIFSDDIKWCKEHAKEFMFGGKHAYFFEGDEYTDLAMMASCSHNIIANSTFSWWGAWLNKNPDKIVVSPHHTNWFGPNGPTKTEDLIPESWLQIKFR